jgi:hypothetical protein
MDVPQDQLSAALTDTKQLLTERLQMSEEVVKSLTSQLLANKKQLDEALQLAQHQQRLLQLAQGAQQAPSYNPFDDVVQPVYCIRKVVKLTLQLPTIDDETNWSLILLVDGQEVEPNTFRQVTTVEHLTSPTVLGVSKKARRGLLKFQFRWSAMAASRNLNCRNAPFTFCLRGGSDRFVSNDFTIRVR